MSQTTGDHKITYMYPKQIVFRLSHIHCIWGWVPKIFFREARWYIYQRWVRCKKYFVPTPFYRGYKTPNLNRRITVFHLSRKQKRRV